MLLKLKSVLVITFCLVTISTSKRLNPSYKQFGTWGLELEDKAQFVGGKWKYGQLLYRFTKDGSSIGKIEGEEHNSIECQTDPISRKSTDIVEAKLIIKLCYTISKTLTHFYLLKEKPKLDEIVKKVAGDFKVDIKFEDQVLINNAVLNIDIKPSMFPQLNINVDLWKFYTMGNRDNDLIDISFIDGNTGKGCKDKEYGVLISEGFCKSYRRLPGKPLKFVKEDGLTMCDVLVKVQRDNEFIIQLNDYLKEDDAGAWKNSWNWMPKFKLPITMLEKCMKEKPSDYGQQDTDVRGRGVSELFLVTPHEFYGTIELRSSAVNIMRPLGYYNFLIEHLDESIDKFVTKMNSFLGRYLTGDVAAMSSLSPKLYAFTNPTIKLPPDYGQ